ncbi:translation initiation factor IF3-2, chloroplastic isoform X2 [Ziziphus jujuba]|uniref:Translation initiation factor IF-3 n=1 Tax=Ziziphus jujuba TaxID=326968 RepID=A0ABM3IPZ0_ZIZJJ|nr:translation initiation factor IF3-2, chloroplastic-like isoform X2 [Ziziphus jujuba var. spinosa]XP_048332915.1 translation initiation factor IF3-2, chloroplastic isoform X2 [Ziziphus jujuba]
MVEGAQLSNAMAGIATGCPLKLVHTQTSTNTTPSLLPISSSFDSKLFGLRLQNSSLAKSSSLVYASSSFSAAITSRYGGGSRYSGPDKRSRQSYSDDDQALDISTIRSDSVRLIDENQNMVGIVSKSEAVRIAEDAELDLVILSPDADPPVVKIMDYNKYRYEQQKKKRDQQKKSAASRMALKELKMGYNIDQHDYSVRLKAARKFLKDGDKLATEEAKNFRDRNIFIILVPNRTVLQKGQEPPAKKDKSAVNEVSAGV